MATNKPRYRPKLADLNDIANELAKVYREVRNGDIPVNDSSKICYLLRELFSMRKDIVTTTAIEELEAKVKALTEGHSVGNDAEIEEAAKSLR